MSDLMEYKGYYGAIFYSLPDEVFVARAIGINDYISCHGDTIDETKKEFKDSIDHYLEVCEGEGLEPDITDPCYAERLHQLIRKQNNDFKIIFDSIEDLVFAS